MIDLIFSVLYSKVRMKKLRRRKSSSLILSSSSGTFTSCSIISFRFCLSSTKCVENL